MKKSGHGGNLKYYSEKYNILQNSLIDFSANINPLKLDNNIFKIITENIANIKDYPEPNSENLLNIAEKKMNIEKEKFIFGNGAAELLFLLVNHLSPKKVYIPAPTFSEYEMAGKAAGAEIIFFNLTNDFQNFEIEFLNNISKGDIVFICNPNNPTGTFFEKEFLEKILFKINQKKAYLFLDESFIDFVDDESFYSFKDKIDESNNLFVLYSLTKIYGIPGLRLGMLFGVPSVINDLYYKKDPWNINLFAQKVGESLLEEKKFLKESKRFFQLERKRLMNKLLQIKELKIYEPSANFIFMEILDGSDVESLQENLIKEKIVIRNCDNYHNLNQKFFRVAIKNPEENDHLILNLKKYFSLR